MEERDTSIEIQIEMAQIIFDDHPDRLSGLSSLEYTPLSMNGVNNQITPVVEYVTDALTGITRPRTISTLVVHDLDPDSRYCFRLTGTTTHDVLDHLDDDDEEEEEALLKVTQEVTPGGEKQKENDDDDDEEEEALLEKEDDKNKMTKSATELKIDLAFKKKNNTNKKDKETPTVSFGLISSSSASTGEVRRSNTLTIETLSETLFMLDATTCGSNLVLSNSNLIVTNTVSVFEKIYFLKICDEKLI